MDEVIIAAADKIFDDATGRVLMEVEEDDGNLDVVQLDKKVVDDMNLSPRKPVQESLEELRRRLDGLKQLEN